jgi:hypothetical protein
MPIAEHAATQLAAEHFRRAVCWAVLHVRDQAAITLGSREEALRRYPFLAAYEEASREFEIGIEWDPAFADTPRGTPISRLCDLAALDRESLLLLLAAGLPEEDDRFGLLYEDQHEARGQRRPSVALFTAWWRGAEDAFAVRANLRRLLDLGLLEAPDSDGPRTEWALSPCHAIWDAIRGEAHDAPMAGLRFDSLAAPEPPLVFTDDTLRTLETLPALLGGGDVRTVVVRGPRSNGRRTFARALCRRLGCGVLEIQGPLKPGDPRARLAGPLAAALDALPLIVYDLAPGETADVPAIHDSLPRIIVAGKQGGLSGPGLLRPLTVDLAIPAPEARRRHWQAELPAQPAAALDDLSRRFRTTSGAARRLARMSAAQAALQGHAVIQPADARRAARALHREALETLAQAIPAAGDWSSLAVAAGTWRELRHLELRCRHRESLRERLGMAIARDWSCGVRALFKGPSGTGKTLAARLLASVLETDLYRIDLGAVVSKYIGETEKNLNQVLAAAEELDVILLFDEGDSLFGQRTGVANSTDRYANLETNFLLQRLDSYEGILLITTNAADRIDSAFERRMDAVIDFQPPDPQERFLIWQIHLPPAHAVPPGYLGEVAGRCELTGGQIRNAAVRASLLALERGAALSAAHVDEAVRQEYRKMGAVCPLRAWREG